MFEYIIMVCQSVVGFVYDARLDVTCRGLWAPLDKAFVDVRVLNPNAMSNANKPLQTMYKHHENEKKRFYNYRILEIEHASFTPLVFSTTGGMSPECETFFKRVAVLLSKKLNQRYSDVITYIRRRIRFELLKTTIISIRGHRGRSFRNPKDVDELDLNLTIELIAE